MLLNAPLLFETALLMLAVFLAGAVTGLGARWLLARPKAPATAAAAITASTPAMSAAPQLVTAPEIAPIAGRPTPADRIAAASAGTSKPVTAASGMSSTIVMPKVTLPEPKAIEPSRVAGETVSGRHIDNPEHLPPADGTESPFSADPSEPDVATTEVAPSSISQPEPSAVQSEPADDEITTPATETPDEPAASSSEAVTSLEDDGETSLPVEARHEPDFKRDDFEVLEGPKEIAAELQDVHETEIPGVAPDVAAEKPLVEPVFERDEEEERAEADAANKVTPADPAAEPTGPEPAAFTVPDELAAMRAIEGGWTPTQPVSARQPADLPEGVTVDDVVAADTAVEKSAAAVANAMARATSVLKDIAPPAEESADGPPGRPQTLKQARDGGKDDLGKIKGVAPAIESSLNGLGIYHFDQIAGWDDKSVAWVENHFGFKGRIVREQWQEQARELARKAD